LTLRERLFVGVLMTGSATTALVLVVLIPVLPMLAESFGGGSEGAQLSQAVMTSPALGLIAGGFLSAAAVKAVGTFRLLLAGLALYGLAGTAGLYVSGAPLMLGSRFLLGVAASFVGIGTTALIAARYEAVKRAKLLGIKGALGSVGGISGILLGGELGSLGGWRLPFAVYGFGFLLLALLFIARGKATQPAPVAVPPPGTAMKPDASLLSLWPFYLVIVVFGVVLMMTTTQLSFLLDEIGIDEPSQVSRIAVMASVGAMIGGFGYGRLAAWIGLERIFPVAFLNWSLGLGLLGFAQTPLAATIGCVITGISAGLYMPHMISTLAVKADDKIRDRAIAMLYSAIFLGDFLNPFVVEPMSVALTRHGAFRAVAAFTFLSFLFTLYRYMRRRN
tara:strand:- start:199499 stop:200671 length:1173 start_codon:yes stop_codon:yes gene_type:complete